jgi:hypothetical protein
VKSKRHPHFRRDFMRLPDAIKRQAREAYKRFQVDPFHSGLEFKRLNLKQPLWSVRINDSYRAVGVRTSNDEIIWFFIGPHSDYDKLLSRL